MIYLYLHQSKLHNYFKKLKCKITFQAIFLSFIKKIEINKIILRENKFIFKKTKKVEYSFNCHIRKLNDFMDKCPYVVKDSKA